MREYLKEFFSEFQYPEEAREQLLSDYDKLTNSPKSRELFEQMIQGYEETGTLDKEETLQQAVCAAKEAGVPDDTATFLIFCCLSRHLWELYQQRGISRTVWHDSMYDLLVKAYECKKVKGYWGSFVSGWFAGWFQMIRFALGRLQFEKGQYAASCGPYSGHGITLSSTEDTVINVHIPSGSRLPYEAVLDSYRQAYRWYRDHHRDGKLVFSCWSWLMYDKMPQIAVEGTNTSKFIMDYEIVKSFEDAQFEDCWRLFDVCYTGDPTLLPRNGGLRRRYAEFLEQGGKAGSGYGIAIFDGEKMLTHN